MATQASTPALLALADGSVFRGAAIGAAGQSAGEVVFNTAMTGYQEILSDPSYARQIVTLTYPHIGNTGVNPEDEEADRLWCAGLVIRDLSQVVSSFRAKQDLSSYLRERQIVGIADIDTRRLTRLLRDKGAQNGACPAECSTYCTKNTCGTGGGTGGGGGSFESRCSPDEGEFCKLHPDMSRMTEKPGNGPCPTQMTCYECTPGYEADTWIDECLAPGEEHFSACADLEGTECLRAADATSAANRAGGTLAGEILTQYVGKVTGEPGTYWAGKQWAVGYYCPGNVQGSDPWGGAISCYRCRGGYHFENEVCVPDDGQAACDTTENCLYQGACHDVNTIMVEGAGWQTACGQVGTAPPQPYTCNQQKKGDAQKSDGIWFCCATGGIWTTDMTDCPGVR